MTFIVFKRRIGEGRVGGGGGGEGSGWNPRRPKQDRLHK